MTYLDSFSSFPEFLSSHDLVSLGLFASTDSAYVARVRGHSPAFLKIGRKIVYPKASVIQFIQDRLTNSSTRNANIDQSA